MSLNEFNKPLRLRRKSSRILFLYFLLVYMFAALSVFLADLLPVARLILMCVLAFTGIYYFRYYLPNSYDESREWVWQKEDVWTERTNSNIQYWKMQSTYIITPVFIIIRFVNSTGKKCNHLALRDQFNDDEFRRLSVRLKYYQGVAMRIDDTAL